MNHKTNPLKNISQKSKNIFKFLNFILKKIISLQELNKNSAFRYILASESSATSRATRMSDSARVNAGLFLVGRKLKTLEADISSLFRNGKLSKS